MGPEDNFCSTKIVRIPNRVVETMKQGCMTIREITKFSGQDTYYYHMNL